MAAIGDYIINVSLSPCDACLDMLTCKREACIGGGGGVGAVAVAGGVIFGCRG